MERAIYTIGHSTRSTARFLELLGEHGITAVADVRSQPYSRWNPQFNREQLQADLGAAGVGYVFVGRELGARSDDPSSYVGGRVEYDLLARSATFQKGLDRIAKGVSTHRVALMCAEKDPLVCHRSILVCPHLAARGLEPRHILDDGTVETHEEAESRLLREAGLPDVDLFRGREVLVAEAYSLRAREIAYRAADAPAGEPVRGARR